MNKKLEELEKVRAHITKLQNECNKLYNEYKENTPEVEDIEDKVFDYVFNNTLYVYTEIKEVLEA